MSSMGIVKHYGSDLGVEGLKTRYHRFIKSDVELLKKAVESGVDAKTVVLSCDGKIYYFINFLSSTFPFVMTSC